MNRTRRDNGGCRRVVRRPERYAVKKEPRLGRGTFQAENDGYLISCTPSLLDVLGVTAPGLMVPGPGSATTHQPLRQPLDPLPLTNGAPGGLSHCFRSLPLM